MEYYKIIYNNTIIGASTSKQFARYSPVNNCLLYCSKEQGQYIMYNEGLYRDSWMKPLTTTIEYIEAEVEIIDKEEYDILFNALKTVEEIVINEPEEEVIEEPEITPISPTIEFMRMSKLKEMSTLCRQTIEAGFDLDIRGETRHFSLTTQDQLNLMSLSAMAQTQQLIPYHADGEECEFYTADEINEIITKATELKNYNTVYYNSLKTYINALETIEEIAAITYGTPIPEEYKSDVLKVLEY